MRSLLLMLCGLPAGLVAQQATHVVVTGTASQQIVHSRIGEAKDRFTGLVLGAEGRLTARRFAARLRYAEGRITPNPDASLEPREVVEGEALVGFRVAPWLTLWAGPTARAYTTEAGDQRWLIWTGRARARGSLLPGRMQTYVELWSALSGEVANPHATAGGRGADAGLELRLGGESLWGRIAYRIESVHAPERRETVEALSLSLIYGVP